MQNLVKHTLYTFLWITGITALLVIFGLGYLWFFSDKSDLPYLGWMVAAVIVEIVTVSVMLAKKGMKYLPDIQTDKQPKDTSVFMEKFISIGTSVTIVSNRVSWLTGDSNLVSTLESKLTSGTRIEIITPQEVSQEIKSKLHGASFIVTHEANAPEARFTLINGERSGAEKLAISRGVHPDHEITIFDNNSGPQIIAMAKDIIRKSKDLSNAS